MLKGIEEGGGGEGGEHREKRELRESIYSGWGRRSEKKLVR